MCVKKMHDDKIKKQEILPGYTEVYNEYNYQEINCWNCCQKCERIKHYPLKYSNGIFYVSGFFCSDQCSFRYIYDNYKNKELWDKYQLLKFYHKNIYGEFLDLTLPPDRLFLKSFGGNLDINEYISTKYIDEIIIPPIVIINNQTHEKNTNKNLEYLKLYRKKKNKNSILNDLIN